MADSGEEALSLMEERLPDLVMLDINMPGMDGVEVLREIRRKWATDVPVIVVTASG
jgi:CheY-like chemotaxis protein